MVPGVSVRRRWQGCAWEGYRRDKDREERLRRFAAGAHTPNASRAAQHLTVSGGNTTRVHAHTTQVNSCLLGKSGFQSQSSHQPTDAMLARSQPSKTGYAAFRHHMFLERLTPRWARCKRRCAALHKRWREVKETLDFCKRLGSSRSARFLVIHDGTTTPAHR